MSESASISSSIAERYALALFELAKEEGKLPSLEADIESLAGAFKLSDDLRMMIASPIYSREDQTAAVIALAKAMGLSENTRNTLALMASKHRLFVLPELLEALRGMIANEKNEVTAEITSAATLSDDQSTALTGLLKSRFGKDIKLNTKVDETLIGGLVVRVGSKMIDTSIRAKLANLQNAMKEVG